MSKAGLKLVPGSGSLRRRLRRNVRKGLVENAEEAVEIAEKIGYPVGIKAVAGGGGRGIRIAFDSTSLMDFFHTVKAEAQSAFGSTEVYVEKWIENARHIEVQIWQIITGTPSISVNGNVPSSTSIKSWLRKPPLRL